MSCFLVVLAITVILHFCCFFLYFAVTVAFPVRFARIVPLELTDTIFRFELFQRIFLRFRLETVFQFNFLVLPCLIDTLVTLLAFFNYNFGQQFPIHFDVPIFLFQKSTA